MIHRPHSSFWVELLSTPKRLSIWANFPPVHEFVELIVISVFKYLLETAKGLPQSQYARELDVVEYYNSIAKHMTKFDISDIWDDM